MLCGNTSGLRMYVHGYVYDVYVYVCKWLDELASPGKENDVWLRVEAMGRLA